MISLLSSSVVNKTVHNNRAALICVLEQVEVVAEVTSVVPCVLLCSSGPVSSRVPRYGPPLLCRVRLNDAEENSCRSNRPDRFGCGKSCPDKRSRDTFDGQRSLSVAIFALYANAVMWSKTERADLYYTSRSRGALKRNVNELQRE